HLPGRRILRRRAQALTHENIYSDDHRSKESPMASSWTFGRKLALGVAITVAAFTAVALTGLHAARSLIATETGSKAVEAGAVHVAAVARSFREIAAQVHVAIAGLAQTLVQARS